MSWSYYKSGRSEAVAEHARRNLEQTANVCSIGSEADSIRAFSDLIVSACLQAPDQVMRVEGSGSAWLVEDKLRSFQFNAKVELIDISQ